MKEKIFLVGGGGHACACIDVLESTNQFEIAGIFDIQKNVGKTILGYKVIGTDDEIEKYFHVTKNFLLTIGQIKDFSTRMNKFLDLKNRGAHFPVIISPRAYVSKHGKIEEGTIIMHDALVVAGAKIGRNCIINNKALIEHDTVISDFCHISTGAIVNGNCFIEEKCFIGSNSVIKEGLVVRTEVIVPAGTFYKGPKT